MKIAIDQKFMEQYNDMVDSFEGTIRERNIKIAELQSEIERLTAEKATLKSEVEESNGLLRSAFQIAKRDGKDTNWEAFRNQVYIALVRQHEQMYGEESEEE